jgi:hypothetical protein
MRSTRRANYAMVGAPSCRALLPTRRQYGVRRFVGVSVSPVFAPHSASPPKSPPRFVQPVEPLEPPCESLCQPPTGRLVDVGHPGRALGQVPHFDRAPRPAWHRSKSDPPIAAPVRIPFPALQELRLKAGRPASEKCIDRVRRRLWRHSNPREAPQDLCVPGERTGQDERPEGVPPGAIQPGGEPSTPIRLITQVKPDGR